MAMNRRELIAGLLGMTAGTALTTDGESQAHGGLIKGQAKEITWNDLPNNELRLLVDIDLADDGVTLVKTYITIPFVNFDEC